MTKHILFFDLYNYTSWVENFDLRVSSYSCKKSPNVYKEKFTIKDSSRDEDNEHRSYQTLSRLFVSTSPSLLFWFLTLSFIFLPLPKTHHSLSYSFRHPPSIIPPLKLSSTTPTRLSVQSYDNQKFRFSNLVFPVSLPLPF